MMRGHQQFFDDFLSHIRRQRSPGVDEDGCCLYFDSKTGNRCGVGHIISSVYDKRFEGKNWNCLIKWPYAQPAIKLVDEKYNIDSAGKDRKFVDQLQRCHDDAHEASTTKQTDFLYEFEQLCMLFAKENNLEYPTGSKGL